MEMLEWLPRMAQMYTTWSVLLVLLLTVVPAPTPMRFFAACNMLAVACFYNVNVFIAPDETRHVFVEMGIEDLATMGVINMLLHVLPVLVALPWILGARWSWAFLLAAALPPPLMLLYYRSVYPTVYGQRKPIPPQDLLKIFLLYALILFSSSSFSGHRI